MKKHLICISLLLAFWITAGAQVVKAVYEADYYPSGRVGNKPPAIQGDNPLLGLPYMMRMLYRVEADSRYLRLQGEFLGSTDTPGINLQFEGEKTEIIIDRQLGAAWYPKEKKFARVKTYSLSGSCNASAKEQLRYLKNMDSSYSLVFSNSLPAFCSPGMVLLPGSGCGGIRVLVSPSLEIRLKGKPVRRKGKLPFAAYFREYTPEKAREYYVFLE